MLTGQAVQLTWQAVQLTWQAVQPDVASVQDTWRLQGVTRVMHLWAFWHAF
jgi:hypothetical protein